MHTYSMTFLPWQANTLITFQVPLNVIKCSDFPRKNLYIKFHRKKKERERVKAEKEFLSIWYNVNLPFWMDLSGTLKRINVYMREREREIMQCA